MKLINKKKACLPARQGFTLVELLLVMAIIGILAGIIFISIGSARKRARITTFKESMKNIAVAATQCTDVGGTISINATANGAADLCAVAGGDGGIGKIPVIKRCDGTSGSMTVGAIDVAHSTGDDFIIQSVCPVGTGNNCYAQCTANGCTFNSAAYVNTGGDGCPKT